MLDQSKKIWFLILSFSFILLNGFFIIQEKFEFLLLPVLLLIIYLALFKMDVLIKVIVFLTPLSISLSEINEGAAIDMALPTEPILFGLMLIFILKLFKDGSFDSKIIRHPVTIAILINLVWIALTSIPSIHPLISFKFLLGRLWFLIGYYFIISQLFKSRKNISQFFWLYIGGFSLVIAYTIIMHSANGFDQKSANWIMGPFFNDHTSYGAALAFLMPFLVFKVFDKDILGTKKLLIFLLLGYFTLALVLSFTRAAWVSVVGSLIVFLVLKFKIKWWVITVGFIFSAVLLIGLWTQLSTSMASNKQDSSSNLKEHVSSISNVTSDASNLERLNRWNAAYEMFKKRPLLGWGPGVYSFEYAPFQKSKDKTIISTNTGDGGNAHSEYLGPLAESGIIGTLSYLLIILTIIYTAVKVYKKPALSPKMRAMVLVSFLGLVSYFIHGILNNFLDTDKISALFWGMTAVIVIIDLYHSQEDKEIKT
ncbi:MAG: putative inorganic carbon (HCO3(-)) transporter [Saprospiraceae bacterium]